MAMMPAEKSPNAGRQQEEQKQVDEFFWCLQEADGRRQFQFLWPIL